MPHGWPSSFPIKILRSGVRLPGRLVDLEKLTGPHIVQRLNRAGGPPNLDSRRPRILTETEVYSPRTRGCVSDRSGHMVGLNEPGRRREADCCADCVAVAAASGEPQIEPVLAWITD